MKILTPYLLCIAFGFLMCYTLIAPSKDKKNGVSKERVVTKIDTVYIPKPYPVIKDTTVFVKQPYKVTKLDTVYLVNSRSYYKDSVEIEKDLTLTYSAITTGTLDSISLGYIDNRPDKVITKETTITKYRNGLYLGATTDLSLNASVGVMYQRNKSIVGLSTKLNSTSFSSPTKYNLTYYYKIF